MREQLSGTPQVFSFTLARLFRSRANLISMAVSLLMVLVSMPLLTWAGGADVDEGELWDHAQLLTVAVDNRSDLAPDFSALAREEYWTGVDFAAPADSAEALVRLDGTLDQGYSVTVTGSAREEDLSTLEWDVVWLVDLARIAKAGVTDAQLDILWGDYNVVLPGDGTMAPDEFFDEEITVDGDELMDGFWLQYGYAIVVMMLCLLSASYVIRTVVEEKDSKLVELLLLSVRPLALLTGKILAAMVYVVGYLVLVAAGWALSLLITGAIFGRESVSGVLDILSALVPMLAAGGNGAVLAVVLVVSLLLGYLTMGIIGGLSGACCSSMDEINSASGTVTMITMVGYLGACIVSAIPGKGLAVFSALCPILSMFCAPVQYARGGIEWWILLISWLLQLALVAGLAWLAARVYAELIIHRGSRVKWKELLAMAKRGLGR